MGKASMWVEKLGDKTNNFVSSQNGYNFPQRICGSNTAETQYQIQRTNLKKKDSKFQEHITKEGHQGPHSAPSRVQTLEAEQVGRNRDRSGYEETELYQPKHTRRGDEYKGRRRAPAARPPQPQSRSALYSYRSSSSHKGKRRSATKETTDAGDVEEQALEGGEEEEEEGEEPVKSEFSGWSSVSDKDEAQLPRVNVEYDLGLAKRYLESLGERNETVWSHLNEIVTHILRERPEDSMRYFEELSRDLRTRRYIVEAESCPEERVIPPSLKEAYHNLRFYRKVECLHEEDDPYTDDTPADRNLLENYALLQEAGVGIPEVLLYNIYMGIRYLSKKESVTSLKLWGIVRGIEGNYIVVKGTLTKEALEKRQKTFRGEKEEDTENQEKKVTFGADEKDKTIKEKVDEIEKDKPEEDVKPEEAAPDTIKEDIMTPVQMGFYYTFPPVPQAKVPEKAKPPPEPPGEGANKYVYYVNRDPTRHWTMLPDVLPEHILAARKIHRFLTGRLDEDIETYPEFPGKEAELLRAQIARISASTHVSPAGYFIGANEEESAVVPEEGEDYAEDPDYEPLPVKNLLDDSLEFWVHHEKYIMGHGTSSPWQAPKSVKDEVEEIEDEEEGEGMGLEMPPEILRQLKEDKMEEPAPPWTTRQTSTTMEDDSAVMIRSNIWPGAITVTRGKEFLNFYSGWAMKTQFRGYRPLNPGPIQTEYPLGPEVMEMQDPSAELEEMRWQLLHPKPRKMEGELEEEFEPEERDEMN